MQMYSEADVDTSALLDRQITILGYGSQGRAHALNLKDSGFDVVVGLRRDGASWAKAEADGLKVQEPVEAVKRAAIVAFLTPDMVQKSLYASIIDAIDENAALLFAHGFAASSTLYTGARVIAAAKRKGRAKRGPNCPLDLGDLFRSPSRPYPACRHRRPPRLSSRASRPPWLRW